MEDLSHFILLVNGILAGIYGEDFKVEVVRALQGQDSPQHVQKLAAVLMENSHSCMKRFAQDHQNGMFKNMGKEDLTHEIALRKANSYLQTIRNEYRPIPAILH